MTVRRCLLTLGALALLGLAALGSPAGATPPLPGERIGPGVSAGGVEVSGMTVDEAARLLELAYAARLRQDIVVQAADVTFRLRAATARVRFDPKHTATRALHAGRQQAAGSPAVDVALAVTASKAAVTRFVGRVDRRLHRAPRDSKVRITVRRVRVSHSRVGRDIDAKALATQVNAALLDARRTRVLKPRLKRVRPKVTADEARRTVSTVLTIHQGTFTLRLFKNLKVVKRYKVAVGQPAYPTPRGRFAIVSKQVNPVWSVPNSPWAGELAGTTVAGGTAGNPLKARWMGIVNGVGIHGTGQGYSIGTRASHGCIRMHVPDVIALYKRVPVGTTVLIG